MRNWCYLVVCFLLVLGCKNQPGESSTFAQSDSLKTGKKDEAVSPEKGALSLLADEDSIRKNHAVSDSITLIKKIYIDEEPQYAFIIHSKKTDFHRRFREMFSDFSDREGDVYEEAYQGLREKYKDSTLAPLTSYKDLVADWIPVYSYKGNFYVLRPCGILEVKQITDTAFVEHFMEGPSPRLVLNVERNAGEITIRVTGALLRFKLVDAARSIYLFSDDGYRWQYLIPLQKVKEFPIIVEHCTEDGVSLVEFDPVRP